MRGLLLGLCLVGCSPTPSGLALTYDGYELPVAATSTTLATIDGARVVTALVGAGSDVDASDAGTTFGLRIALDPTIARGASSHVAGTTTFAGDAESFAPGAGHDPRVLGISASVSGMLTSTVLDERCSGTIEVVDTSSTSITLHVDVTIVRRAASGTDTLHFLGTIQAR